MAPDLSVQQVEVSFVGAPPAQQVRRAAGVSDVEVEGSTLRCLIYGSFQPFLEALRGHEVISLASNEVGSKPALPAAAASSPAEDYGGIDSFVKAQIEDTRVPGRSTTPISST
jgi:hypothetical protein